ncbi:hypothetical protein BHE74_00033638 [Ensete ventricosum]|nr:hypothetical protein BHE74_00033638 [Ensete ventricosum]
MGGTTIGATVENTLKIGYGRYNRRLGWYNHRLLSGFLGGDGTTEFARRFAEGIRKLIGNTPGEDRKTHRKNAGGYQIGGNQSDTRHVMVSWSLFLLDIFIPTTSHFVLSYAPTSCAYNMMV